MREREPLVVEKNTITVPPEQSILPRSAQLDEVSTENRAVSKFHQICLLFDL